MRPQVVTLYLANTDGLVQERCNSSALAMELHRSCTNPLNYNMLHMINFNLLNLSLQA